MSSKILNKFLYYMGIGENEELEEEQINDTMNKTNTLEVMEANKLKKTNIVDIRTATTPMKVVLVEPTEFEQVQSICDDLKSKKPSVINFENMDKDTARRMVDFISGAVYALNGTIQKISNGIVIVAPANVDILGSIKNTFGSEDFDLEFIKWLK